MRTNRCENFKIVKGRKEICGNILYKGEIVQGKVEIYCHKCKEVTVIDAKNKSKTVILAEIG